MVRGGGLSSASDGRQPTAAAAAGALCSAVLRCTRKLALPALPPFFPQPVPHDSACGTPPLLPLLLHVRPVLGQAAAVATCCLPPCCALRTCGGMQQQQQRAPLAACSSGRSSAAIATV